MEGATPNPICPGVVQSTGPPPSMVKSGISTIEDLSCKDQQQTEKCCPLVAENSTESNNSDRNLIDFNPLPQGDLNSNDISSCLPDVIVSRDIMVLTSVITSTTSGQPISAPVLNSTVTSNGHPLTNNLNGQTSPVNSISQDILRSQTGRLPYKQKHGDQSNPRSRLQTNLTSFLDQSL